MRMLVPTVIDDSKILRTNIPEDDYAEWDVATAYSIGARVMVAAAHQNYEAVAATTGNDPASDDGSNWIPLGATNRFKPFDQFISDPAALAEQIQFEFQPGELCDGLALFGLEGASVQLVVTDPADGEVFNQTKSLVYDTNVFDWYSHFFAPIQTDTEVLFADIPPYPDAVFSVTISNPGANAQVGQIVLGQDYQLGITKAGTSLAFEDYSRKERDVFGRPIIVERAYAQLIDFDFAIVTGNSRFTLSLIAAQRAKPAVFYTAPDRQDLGTLVYGITGPLNINLSSANISDVTLEVEGLV